MNHRSVAIGNFDGVHLGHVAVLADAGVLSKKRGLDLCVMTFDPHPAKVLGRNPPPLLTTLERKVELLERAGVDHVHVQTFDAELAAFTPERFVRELLVSMLGAKLVVVGENFRFGARRAGDFALMRALGEQHGFEAHAFGMVSDASGPYSSTRAREAIIRGDTGEAKRILGRPHAISGTVVHGAMRGRTIGFPTANIAAIGEAMPRNGVYAVVVDKLDGAARALGKGVMNIGQRPTVDASGTTTCEVHLEGLDENLYDARLRVHVWARIRDEQRFESVDALRKQIEKDASDARALTASVSPDKTFF